MALFRSSKRTDAQGRTDAKGRTDAQGRMVSDLCRLEKEGDSREQNRSLGLAGEIERE